MRMSMKRESIFSISSRMAQRQDSEMNFSVMSDEELQQKVEDILQKNWTLSLENDLFERYLARNDPQGLKAVTQILERAKYAQKAGHLMPRSSRMSFRESVITLHDIGRPSIDSSRSRISIQSESRYATPSVLTIGTVGEGPKITLTHRIVMAKKELQEMRKNLIETEDMSTRKKANLRAENEELEIRTHEAYESRDEFEENVVVEGVGAITGKIPAERIVRFVDDWLKTADTIIERLRLKSATIKSQIKKAKHQLMQREELGEALRAVDFEQLNIENQDYVKKIEEKNCYLLEMKKITGRYSLEMTQRKEKLNNLSMKLSAVEKEIGAKEDQILKLESEHETLQNDIEDTRQQLEYLVMLMETYDVPDMLDFVKLKAEFKELQKTYKLLCRQRNLQQIMLKSEKKQNIPNTSNNPSQLFALDS